MRSVRRRVKWTGRSMVTLMLSVFLMLPQNVIAESPAVGPFPTHMPPNLTGDKHTTWLMNDGGFVADSGDVFQTRFEWEPDPKLNGGIIKYDTQGKEQWRAAFEGPQDSRSIAEFADGFFLLTFQRKHASDDTGAGFCTFIGWCKPKGIRYLEGIYRLHKCDAFGKCQMVKTFDQGVFEIAINSKGLWASEYQFKDVEYAWGVDGGLPSARVGAISHFDIETLSFREKIDGWRFRGLSSSTDESLYYLGATKDKPMRSGIRQDGNELTRVGGYSISQVSRCQSIFYLPMTKETVCISGAQVARYEVTIIGEDGSIKKSLTYSHIYPKLLADGRVLVATKDGKISDIHLAMGE